MYSIDRDFPINLDPEYQNALRGFHDTVAGKQEEYCGYFSGKTLHSAVREPFKPSEEGIFRISRNALRTDTPNRFDRSFQALFGYEIRGLTDTGIELVVITPYFHCGAERFNRPLGYVMSGGQIGVDCAEWLRGGSHVFRELGDRGMRGTIADIVKGMSDVVSNWKPVTEISK